MYTRGLHYKVNPTRPCPKKRHRYKSSLLQSDQPWKIVRQGVDSQYQYPALLTHREKTMKSLSTTEWAKPYPVRSEYRGEASECFSF